MTHRRDEKPIWRNELKSDCDEHDTNDGSIEAPKQHTEKKKKSVDASRNSKVPG